MLRYHHGDHHWQICAKYTNVQCQRNSYTLELLPSHENASLCTSFVPTILVVVTPSSSKTNRSRQDSVFWEKTFLFDQESPRLATAAAGRREAEPFKFHTSTFFDDFWWTKNVTFDGSYVHTTAIAAARHFWIIPHVVTPIGYWC